MDLKTIALTALMATSVVKADEGFKDLYHFGISGASSFSSSFILDKTKHNLSLTKKCVIGGAVGMVPGVVKEAHDYVKVKNFSMRDISTDFVGCVIGSMLYYHMKTESYISFSHNELMFNYRF